MPKKCPKQISCITASNSDPKAKGKEDTLEEMMTPPGKVSAKRNYPVVDTCLRRSSRVKHVSDGFKKDTCSDRRCLACTPNPPTLSTQVIRKLGNELYQLEGEDLSDEVLLTKKEQTSMVGRKKLGSTKKKRSNGDGPEKKNKKQNDDSNNRSRQISFGRTEI